MYTIAVKTEFIAQHYLIGGDWGEENKLHSHHYYVELQLSGNTLDNHSFLVDIVDIEKNLVEIVNKYKDQTLNNFSEFTGLNPSIELFSRIICENLNSKIHAENINFLKVIIWENDIAWASFSITR